MPNTETSAVRYRETRGTRSPLPWIVLALLVSAIAVAAYFFLAKPAEKIKGSVVPDDGVSAPAIGAETESEKSDENYDFDDGLRNPASLQTGELDEFGEGVSETAEYNYTVGGAAMRITRTLNENGTAHFYYDYKIELDGKDITPGEFRTVESADCSLQKLRFIFIPEFHVVKISREWDESWITPTVAKKTIYNLSGGKLSAARTEQLKKICNVSDLF